ncbi:hypothetical protein [Miltoncostaea oceani]|jgi:hypothetical protein|uniref:hypothetical protein n=1 Tax=Miltoncostaea oceani TaxID=2843216 RepID=UPI001C3E31C8|nr:hypothetical protein [Miltoncostaea oceani]
MPDSNRPDDFDPDRWDAAFIIARDGPRELEEGVYRRTLASRNDGWLARGGLLRLHADHLSFAPSPMERLLFARALRIDFAEITAVERLPPRDGEVLPGGVAPRMRLRTQSRTYDFVFPVGLDDWMASVKERRQIWDNRQRFL